MMNAYRETLRRMARLRQRMRHTLMKQKPWSDGSHPQGDWRRHKALLARIDRFRKTLGVTRAEEWWTPAYDPDALEMHRAYAAQPAYGLSGCKGTLRVWPHSEPGWTISLCTRCDVRIEI